MADFAPTYPGEIRLTEFLDRWASFNTGSPRQSMYRRGGSTKSCTASAESPPTPRYDFHAPWG